MSRLALLVMCVDMCATPQRRTHTRVWILEVYVDRGKRDSLPLNPPPTFLPRSPSTFPNSLSLSPFSPLGTGVVCGGVCVCGVGVCVVCMFCLVWLVVKVRLRVRVRNKSRV